MNNLGRAHCPICNSLSSTSILNRGSVPVLQNGLFLTEDAAQKVSAGNLDFRHCSDCGFVWNEDFDESLIKYDGDYENCQTYSDLFSKHVDSRITAVGANLRSDQTGVVVEIGCGQGHFLSRLAAQKRQDDLLCIGFDPAWRGANGEGPAGTRIFRSQEDMMNCLSDTPIDVIVTRHTIEHISDPISFLDQIVRLTGQTKLTKLFIETPCNKWIRENIAFQDLFYEHCSIFDSTSLSLALKKADIVPVKIERVFGDQYLWAEAEITTGVPSGEAFSTFVEKWTNLLTTAAKSGPVCIWGAGAKGSTFINICDPGGSFVEYVVDINPKKQGHFLPRSRNAILSPQDAAKLNISAVFIMNPIYRQEIIDLMVDLGWSASVYTLNYD